MKDLTEKNEARSGVFVLVGVVVYGRERKRRKAMAGRNARHRRSRERSYAFAISSRKRLFA
ncbi:MAG: hypothetical protein J6Z13_01920, partial [Clostridia bacterium]|nr:hypothetical protein [Clostridia bacterium]